MRTSQHLCYNSSRYFSKLYILIVLVQFYICTSILFLGLGAMQYATLLTATLAITATALSIARPDQTVLNDSSDVERYLVEFGPEDTRWVTEDEKWELRRVS